MIYVYRKEPSGATDTCQSRVDRGLSERCTTGPGLAPDTRFVQTSSTFCFEDLGGLFKRPVHSVLRTWVVCSNVQYILF